MLDGRVAVLCVIDLSARSEAASTWPARTNVYRVSHMMLGDLVVARERGGGSAARVRNAELSVAGMAGWDGWHMGWQATRG